MYCRRCGSENDDNAYRCIRCGQILYRESAPGPAQRIPTYLAQSILVTLFCCLPFGIPAIVYAAQVGAKIQAGDIEGAIDASNKAKMWTWISFGLGLAGVIIYGIFVAIMAIASTAAN